MLSTSTLVQLARQQMAPGRRTAWRARRARRGGAGRRPNWTALRGANALRVDGPTPGLRLDDWFALNPAMPNLYRLYRAGEASIVHAVATPYRERSHFNGQDVLESGLAAPGAADTGWLNRALGALDRGGRVNPNDGSAGVHKAFAVGPVTPLVVRGPAPVLSWTPPRLEPATDDTLMRLLEPIGTLTPRWRVHLKSASGLPPLRAPAAWK
jgi:uncharacterized protein (DUF1501 family)